MNAVVASPSTVKVTREDLAKTASPSRLNTFHTCRLQFYFRYVLQLKSTTTPARQVGSAVHHALSLWNKARWRKEVLPAEKLEAQFNEYWDHPAAIKWDTGEEAESKVEAWKLVQTYLHNTPIPANESAEGVEVRVECDLQHHGLPRLIGILDLIRPAGLIVDFKTCAQTPNPEKAQHLHELQTTAYALLYRDATGRLERGLELHHLVKLKTPKLVVTNLAPINETQKSRLFRQLESYVNGVLGEDWVPSPSPMSCSSCEYFNKCRHWG